MTHSSSTRKGDGGCFHCKEVEYEVVGTNFVS